jgi:hypothetical protein
MDMRARARDLGRRILAGAPNAPAPDAPFPGVHRLHTLRGLHDLIQRLRPADTGPCAVGTIGRLPRLPAGPGAYRPRAYRALLYRGWAGEPSPEPWAFEVHYQRIGQYLGTLAEDTQGLFYVDDPEDLDAGIEVQFGRVSFADALEMALALAFLRRAHHFADPRVHAEVAARIGHRDTPQAAGRGTTVALVA